MNAVNLPEVMPLIGQIASSLQSFMASRGRDSFVMIGIHTGGAWVAQELHRLLELPEPLGTLNIAFYRDDFSRIGMHPSVTPSNLPFEVEDRHVVLVDDVLHTGRTIRAALNEIFDYGRPASISLAVLVERSGRELPIQTEVAGCSLDLATTEHVKLGGPEPLRLELRQGPG